MQGREMYVIFFFFVMGNFVFLSLEKMIFCIMKQLVVWGLNMKLGNWEVLLLVDSFV